eukprot:jgi/Ulvmu1/9574/UM054_0004.1
MARWSLLTCLTRTQEGLRSLTKPPARSLPRRGQLLRWVRPRLIRSAMAAILCSLCLLCLVTGLFLLRSTSSGWRSAQQPHGILVSRPSLTASLATHTLVLYSFDGFDPESHANLVFFVKHGMLGCAKCEYIVVVNNEPGTKVSKLPWLPRNARYMRPRRHCHGWGAYDAVLRRGVLDVTKYHYFIFLSSSVRGPFLPAYLQGQIHFTSLMTSRLVGDVKLVGPTISCEAAADAVPPGAPLHGQPHVQAAAAATDAVGMHLLLRDGLVFACHATPQHAVLHSELGASAAILTAGYNIDSFMGRYQGVDWRDERMWGCNGGENPLAAARVHTASLAPMEVMFATVTRTMLQLRYPAAMAASAYDEWSSHSATRSEIVRASVVAAERKWEARAPFVLQAAAIGLDCFDCDFYLHRHYDLHSLTCWEAFTHFVNYGQFEMRSHRFTCDTALKDKAVPYSPADDGLPWPRIFRDGCNTGAPTAANTAMATSPEDLRARAEQYRRRVGSLRQELQMLRKIQADGGGAAGMRALGGAARRS